MTETGLKPLMVTIPGWEAGKGAGAVGSRDETRGVRVPAGAKVGSWDKRTDERYGIDSLVLISDHRAIHIAI